ncbi:MAG: UPF0164 family protein [Treponema sp.]|nr:UPF0164 family protein [Treponema sp.]
MKRFLILAVSALFFFTHGIYALNFDSDSYGSISDFFDSIFGPDENAGLTAFPVLNIPMGGRAEGMAGAFSAVSDDASFIEFNPAGSSYLNLSELALFHNNWIGSTKIEGLSYTNRIGDLGYAAGTKWLYTPFTEYNIYGERVSKGYYTEGTAILNVSYNFFSNYYFSGLSVGANLKGAFRIMPDYTDSDDLGNPRGDLISGSGLSQSAFMMMADAGLLTRFNFLKTYSSRDNNASAALVLRNLGPPSMNESLPTAVVAGFSYKPLKPLLVSFDFTLPLNFTDLSLSEKPYWAIGLSAAVTNFLSMRMGVMGKSGSARITVGSAVTLNKIALDINYTLDLLTQMQPLNRVSLGVRFNLGDGGRAATAARVDELYLSGLDAYGEGRNQDALSYWEEALRLNPKFQPAREGIGIIQGAMNIQQRIRDMQTLNF